MYERSDINANQQNEINFEWTKQRLSLVKQNVFNYKEIATVSC